MFMAFAMGMPSQAFAGAWNLDRNTGQIIVTGEFSSGNSFFTNDGSLSPAEFSKTETLIYFEHGIVPKWTFVAASSLEMTGFQSEESNFNFDDFGDSQFGLRYQVKRNKDLAVALQASFILDGGPLDNIIDIGGSRDAVELRALWGQSYETKKYGDIFIDAQIAGRLRLDGVYDDTRIDFTFGYKPIPKWFIIGQSFNTFRPAQASMDFRVARQIQLKSSASIGYEYRPNRIVQLGYSETVFGRNVIREKGFFVSTWFRY